MTTGATAFFTGTYDEALELLKHARDYLVVEQAKPSRLRARQRLLFARESLRLTARLTRLMAWLLAERAVQRGEMSRADALADDFALSGRGVCLTRPDDAASLPQPLLDLLADSERLYRRLMRLDQFIRRDHAWP
jgi:regulator of CtrA degradation